MTPKQQELLCVRYEIRVLQRMEREILVELRAECTHPIREPLKLVAGERCSLCGMCRFEGELQGWR